MKISHRSVPGIVLVLSALVGTWSCNGGNKSDGSEGGTQGLSKNKGPQKPLTPKTDTVSNKGPEITFERPAAVKGIYLTAWSAGSPNKLGKMMKLVNSTELNSVVIDVRDSGDMYFPTHIPLSDEVQGKKNLAVTNPKKLLATLAAHHIWPIARIACFRDNYVPLKHPDRAVQLSNGQPWHDRSKHYWLDPYDKRNWMYIGQTVDYAMSIGFPEIQLDYVRFPSEGKSSSQVFPNQKKYSSTPVKHEDVIAAFANYIRDKVKKQNKYLSVDIFGIISESKSDQGIGQELEKVAAPFDTISPMIYPSHFAKGEYGIKDPNATPYQIIMKSLRDYRRRLPKASVRPWLQAFPWGGIHYGRAQIGAQIKALNDSGYKEFLLWHAGNAYTADEMRSKSEAEKAEAKMKPPAEETEVSKPPTSAPGPGAPPQSAKK